MRRGAGFGVRPAGLLALAAWIVAAFLQPEIIERWHAFGWRGWLAPLAFCRLWVNLLLFLLLARSVQGVAGRAPLAGGPGAGGGGGWPLRWTPRSAAWEGGVGLAALAVLIVILPALRSTAAARGEGQLEGRDAATAGPRSRPLSIGEADEHDGPGEPDEPDEPDEPGESIVRRSPAPMADGAVLHTAMGWSRYELRRGRRVLVSLPGFDLFEPMAGEAGVVFTASPRSGRADEAVWLRTPDGDLSVLSPTGASCDDPQILGCEVVFRCRRGGAWRGMWVDACRADADAIELGHLPPLTRLRLLPDRESLILHPVGDTALERHPLLPLAAPTVSPVPRPPGTLRDLAIADDGCDAVAEIVPPGPLAAGRPQLYRLDLCGAPFLRPPVRLSNPTRRSRDPAFNADQSSIWFVSDENEPPFNFQLREMLLD